MSLRNSSLSLKGRGVETYNILLDTNASELLDRYTFHLSVRKRLFPTWTLFSGNVLIPKKFHNLGVSFLGYTQGDREETIQPPYTEKSTQPIEKGG